MNSVKPNPNFFPPNKTERNPHNSNAHNRFLSKNQHWTQSQAHLFCQKHSTIPLDQHEVAQQILISLWQALLSYNPTKGAPPSEPSPHKPQSAKTSPNSSEPNKNTATSPSTQPSKQTIPTNPEPSLTPSKPTRQRHHKSPRNPQSPPQQQPSPNRPTPLPRLHLRGNQKTLGIQIKGQSEPSPPKNPPKQSLLKSLVGVDCRQKQPKQRQNLRKNAGKRKEVHFLQNKTSRFCY